MTYKLFARDSILALNSGAPFTNSIHVAERWRSWSGMFSETTQ